MFFNLFKHRAILKCFPKKIPKRTFTDSSPSAEFNYKYLLILDFEATCDTIKMPCQEIIEFPCLKINIKNLSNEGQFQEYVKPVGCPILSDFCVDLTGITQDIVNQADTFPTVLEKFENWREKEGLTNENSLYVTSGDWDLGHALPEQCNLCNLSIPSHMLEWADVKKIFGSHETYYNSFSDIMNHFNLPFEGRRHSGIDDCLNMYQAIKQMLKSNMIFKPTSRYADSKVEILTPRQPLTIVYQPFVIGGKNFSKINRKKNRKKKAKK